MAMLWHGLEACELWTWKHKKRFKSSFHAKINNQITCNLSESLDVNGCCKEEGAVEQSRDTQTIYLFNLKDKMATFYAPSQMK